MVVIMTTMTRESISSSENVWSLPTNASMWRNDNNMRYSSAKTSSVSMKNESQASASDEAIDAFAQKILEGCASSASVSLGETVVVDDSLGPYITSSLRKWKDEELAKSDRTPNAVMALKYMPDYQSLCELMHEHCSIGSLDIARQAMEKISHAVFEKRIPNSSKLSTSDTAIQSLSESLSRHGLQISTDPANRGHENVIQVSADHDDDERGMLQGKNMLDSIASPLAVDNLIPLDLLDDPFETQQQQPDNLIQEQNRLISPLLGQQHTDEEAFPPLSAATPNTLPTSTSRSVLKGKVPKGNAPKVDRLANGKSNKGYKADDVAAALFRHSQRSRQSSIDETSNSSTSGASPKLYALHHAGSTPPNNLVSVMGNPYSLSGRSSAALSSSLRSESSQNQQLSSPTITPLSEVEQGQEHLLMIIHHCSEILLSMNPDLSLTASLAASDMCQGNPTAAQYLINAAAAAPPICRHLLNAGCYRADCQFSHDIDSHTCIFWLKGRCARQYDCTSSNANACRFLHGFHPKLLQEIPPEYLVMPSVDEGYQTSLYQDYNEDELNAGFSNGYDYPASNVGNGIYEDFGSLSWGSTSYVQSPAPNSFANIASQGYVRNQSFANTVHPHVGSTTRSLPQDLATPNGIIDIRTLPTAKIPQDLWNPHENRDAAAFRIPHPMERYYYVKNTIYSNRPDVIDLHFQSLKTFAIVLDTLFEDGSIGSSGEGSWIVTGTGHHVGTQTHQKGGGALENAVLQYLVNNYNHLFSIYRGRDRNGQGGAILIVRRAYGV